MLTAQVHFVKKRCYCTHLEPENFEKADPETGAETMLYIEFGCGLSSIPLHILTVHLSVWEGGGGGVKYFFVRRNISLRPYFAMDIAFTFQTEVYLAFWCISIDIRTFC